jgi:hypothetical protein
VLQILVLPPDGFVAIKQGASSLHSHTIFATPPCSIGDITEMLASPEG